MHKLPLYKFLIKSDVASRRKCAQAIKDGKVKVNGRSVKTPLFSVDLEKDTVSLENNVVDIRNILEKDFVYYLLNKPRAYICTVKDTHNRKTILDLVKEKKRIYPVGRLDKDTEGLLLLTNDGELTYRLTHPKFEIDKVYKAVVTPRIKNRDIKKLRSGLIIDKDKKVQAKVRLIKPACPPRRACPAGRPACQADRDYRNNNQSKVELIIHQGIKRQIKKMFAVLDYKVMELERIQLGPLTLANLEKGAYRKLTKKEIKLLKKVVGITK